MGNVEKDNKHINLSNISSIGSLCLIMAIVFALIRFHVYFQLLLHIPIFSLVEASELVLITAAYGLKWLIYLAILSLPQFVKKQDEFTKKQKAILQILISVIGLCYMWIVFNNDPIFRQSIIFPYYFEYWHLIFYLILVLFITTSMLISDSGLIFFRKNRFILPILASVWYATFEGWMGYQTLVSSHHTNNIVVKTKTLGILKTNDTIIDAGRVKGYWFYYNRNTRITNYVKVEDIESVGFESQ